MNIQVALPLGCCFLAMLKAYYDPESAHHAPKAHSFEEKPHSKTVQVTI